MQWRRNSAIGNQSQVREPQSFTCTVHVSRELRSRAAWEFLDRHCAKTAGCCAISIIIELVHGRIDGGRNGTERNGTAHIKSVPTNARITAATAAIRSAVATQLSHGGLGRSRQKSKRASRLSIRPSCPRPGTPAWTGTLIARVSTTRHFAGDYCHSSWPRGRCAWIGSPRIKLLFQHSYLCAANVFADENLMALFTQREKDITTYIDILKEFLQYYA